MPHVMIDIPPLSKADKKRFWIKVDKTSGLGPKGKCWEWRANTVRGYGSFTMRKKKLGAHRVSYFLKHGKIKFGLYVLHKCDSPLCVRPSHLWLGTSSDNALDRELKGRSANSDYFIKNPTPCGEDHPHAKLTAKQVARIRHIYGQGYCLQKHLAEKFGVARSTISAVIRHENWA